MTRVAAFLAGAVVGGWLIRQALNAIEKAVTLP